MSEAGRTPIAIVGIGCRFPGGIRGPRSYWRSLVSGRDVIGPIPADRFDAEALYDGRAGVPGRIATRWGGFLEDLDRFDAEFFGISAREAERLDPQQRLVLEVAWEALEDAALDPTRLAGTRTGVFVGLWLNDYESRLFADASSVDFHSTTGTGRYAAPGRVSHALGLRGPSIAVDSACSSSLVAVHLACRSLWSGETDLALAGGANAILQPHITIAYSQSGMMSPRGRCRFGDAGADGYVRSEGAGMVVLKRLDRALADGDPIHAVILGGAVNNDGGGDHFGTPARSGQEALLRDAYTDAGVDPSAVSYVEAHGTGTAAGDPVEIGALASVVGAQRAHGSECLVGSVKTNIGHTEGAAGIAGLIKAALVVEHGAVPPSLHLETPTPAVDWASAGVRIPTSPTPIERRASAVAGVSSFGIAGTNAHIVVGAAPAAPARPSASHGSLLVPLSAHTPAALRALAADYASWLDGEDAPALADVAWTLARRRAHHEYRMSVVASDAAELRAALSGSGTFRAAHADRPIVFVFPGQGSQWEGMGRRLLEDEPVFRATVEACDAALRPYVEWSLLEQLHAERGSAAWRLDDIDVIQPVLVALDIALAALWRSWGIAPSVVVGHSMGEVAAAAVAGALSLDDAMRVIATRSRLLRRISGRGAMAVVELPESDARAALAGRDSLLSVAASNSPRSTVVAGDPDAVDALLAELEARDVFCRRIAVDVASHSPQVDGLAGELRALLSGLAPSRAEVPLRSTVTAEATDGRALDAEYWVRNLRAPVRFARVVADIAREAVESGGPIFLEVSPHPVLLPSVEQTLGVESLEGLAVGSLRRSEPERETMLASLGTLYEAGATPAWERVLPEGAPVRLPPYPWQRERYWLNIAPRVATAGGHPVLGMPLRAASGARVWEGAIRGAELARLREHRVRGRAVVPAGSFLELAFAAIADLDGAHALEAVRFEGLLEIESEPGPAVQLAIDAPASGTRALAIHARSGSDDDVAWTRHASAHVLTGDTTPRNAPGPAGGTEVPHYTMLEERGLEYGPAFRRVDAVVRTPDGLAATIRGGAPITDAAVLDAVLQVGLLATAANADPDDTLVPVEIGAIQLHADRMHAPAELHVFATASTDAGRADLVVSDTNGVVMTVASARFARLPRRPEEEPALFRIDWRPAPLSGTARTAQRWFTTGDAARMVAQELEAAGHTVVDAGADVDHVVYVTGPVSADVDPVEVQERGALDVLTVAQKAAAAAKPPKFWVVAPSGEAGPLAAALNGLCAVLANEHPALAPVRIITDEPASIVDELLRGGDEPRVRYEDGVRQVARLMRADEATHAPGTPPAYRLGTSRAGSLENLRLEAAPRRAPAAHEIEIEVHAAGLNFMNVLSALAAYPGAPGGLGPLGIECAGVVTATGAEVTDLKPGDRVMAYSHDAMGSHALCDAQLAARIADDVSFADAASFLVAHLTAWHGLVRLARLRPGERVLIHSATGGVGMAALRIARNVGAEIVATAGRDAKRAWLRAQGIAHVFDSRASFADDVLAATSGEGVDVVLNSLPGAAVAEGLRVLRPYGRFIELGKRDIYDEAPLPLSEFRRNLSYFAVDLDRMATERPAELGEILSEVCTELERGRLVPLPVRRFGIADAQAAFAEMAAARHVGKVVLEMQPVDELRAHIEYVTPVLRADATYLITGGTGALGRATARRLALRGAGTLVLAGRNASVSDDAMAALGADVHVVACDVSDEGAVAELLDRIDRELPPLRGIVHAPGVLADARIDALDRDRFLEPFAGKVRGAWLLDRRTRDRPLDFFVLYSSVAATLGTVGQANYAAANACLDALARQRRDAGLPALSIAWGPWTRIGLAAERDDRGARLARSGLPGLDPEDGLALLDRALLSDETHLLATRIDAARWSAHAPGSVRLLSELHTGEAAAQSSAAAFADVLRAAGADAEALLLERIRERVAGVLRVDPAKVPPGSPFKRLGLDSLMGLELRNRLEADLGTPIPATTIWNHPTAERLARHLVSKFADEPPAPPAATDDLEALLEAELAAAQRVLRGQP